MHQSSAPLAAVHLAVLVTAPRELSWSAAQPDTSAVVTVAVVDQPAPPAAGAVYSATQHAIADQPTQAVPATQGQPVVVALVTHFEAVMAELCEPGGAAEHPTAAVSLVPLKV